MTVGTVPHSIVTVAGATNAEIIVACQAACSNSAYCNVITVFADGKCFLDSSSSLLSSAYGSVSYANGPFATLSTPSIAFKTAPSRLATGKSIFSALNGTLGAGDATATFPFATFATTGASAATQLSKVTITGLTFGAFLWECEQICHGKPACNGLTITFPSGTTPPGSVAAYTTSPVAASCTTYSGAASYTTAAERTAVSTWVEVAASRF